MLIEAKGKDLTIMGGGAVTLGRGEESQDRSEGKRSEAAKKVNEEAKGGRRRRVLHFVQSQRSPNIPTWVIFLKPPRSCVQLPTPTPAPKGLRRGREGRN